MESPPHSTVLEANQLDGGLVITFEDGQTAFYPGELLREIFTRAYKLEDELGAEPFSG